MYRKAIYLVVLVCVLGFGMTAQAQLFDPPLNNPSFEATDLGAAGGWVDYAEEWIISAQGDCYLENGSWQIPAPDGGGTLKMWGGAGLWQQIGSWTPSTEYEISLFVGRGFETSEVQVELWAGGNPALIPNSGFGTIDATVGATLVGSGPLVPAVPVGENEWMTLVLNTGAGFNMNDAMWLRIESAGEGAWVDNITVVSLVDPAIAYNPSPASMSTDVVRDVVVSWTPGIFALKHDVYFGTNLDDVASASRTNPLDVLAIEGQDADTYDVGRLAFGETYFWRVDEVNGTPDRTVFKGDIWSFEVEPYAVKLSSDMMTATASSSSNDTTEPSKTIDGSGLDQDDLHSNLPHDMWMSTPGDLSPWLMYEFDKTQKLDHLLIWNSNHSSEPVIGWGIKDVNIEVSLDGVDWTPMPDVGELTRGPGHEPSEAQVIDMGLVQARYVRLDILSNWGGVIQQYGVGEVQFYAIPVQARSPEPASGSVDVLPGTVIKWRAGREAAEHTVYVSTDTDVVADGSAPSVTSTTNSLDLASLDLQLGQTYYWRVDEVNNAEVVTTWPGNVWNFTTSENLIVDDFESYNSIPVDQEGSHRVYMVWADGYAADPSANGSTMGYLNAPFRDANDVHGGNYSVPLFYDNTTAPLSEVTCNTNDLPIGSNWSIGSPQALVVWLRGDAGNDSAADQLYVKVDNANVLYEGDISLTQWRPWSIDLSALGVDLIHVSTLTIGLERLGGSGGKGVVLLDDIMLYGVAPAVLTQPDPEDNLTTNPSLESPDWGPSGTEQWADKVDNWIIDAQGSSYLEDGTWQIVAPDGVATLKMWNGAALWQQIGNVRPNTDYEITLFIGRGYDASAVQVELWAGGDPSLLPDSYGILAETVGATLIGGTSLTPTIAVGQNELMGASINTGAEFGPEDALWVRIQSIGGDGTAAWVDNVMVAVPPQNLTVNPSLEFPDWGPSGTGQWADKVNDWVINVQGNGYLEDGSWDIVAPDGVATLKMWHGGALWQQIGHVLPNTDYEISLFVGRGYDTSAVQVELWAGGDPSLLPVSFGIIGDTVGATLIEGASLTPTTVLGQSEWMSLSLNTGADFGTQDALWVRIESTGGDGTGTWVDYVTVTVP